jgi:DNA polymerase-3 subunit alpha
LELEEKDEFLMFLCDKGMQAIGKDKDPIYISRLVYELKRIIFKGYGNYFLVVWDLFRFCREKDIAVGPGRGSVGASLISLCLQITTVDPIEFNLMFDRFISEIRKDFPDIDMDFEDNRRHEIVEYVINKYGADKTAQVVTYARFHPKGVMKDIGRIFKIPLWEIENISKLVIIRSGGDARASLGLHDTFQEFEAAKKFQEKYPQATEVAIKLEGHIRHKGKHAAGVICTENDISEYVPLTKVNGDIVTEFEKFQDEDLRLVKLDILGLKTLTVIKDCLEETKAVLPKTFDDLVVYQKVFWEGNTLGIFQFESVGLQKMVSQLKPTQFKTLYDATTLYRPGALHSGTAMVYVARHLGKEPVVYEHPLLKEVTESTLGIILYQEQIMEIMFKIGKMSWATAEMSRKIISKSRGAKAFESVRAEFVNNAVNYNHFERADAEKLFDNVCMFGSYSYNKIHAIEYSMISYYTAWLKTYHTKAFLKAMLKYENDDSQISNYLQEAKRMGVNVEYPDINKSEYSYCLKDGEIYAGLRSIKGIGESAARKIVAGQPYKSVDDFKARAGVGEAIFKGLAIADAFRSFGINKKRVIEKVQTSLFNFNERVDDYTEIEHTKLLLEHTTLRPKVDIRTTFYWGDHQFTDIANTGEKVANQSGLIRGIVTDVINKDKLIRASAGEHVHKFEPHMIYLNVNDGTGNLAVQVNPHTYDRYKEMVNDLKNKPVIAMGIFANSGMKLVCDLLQIPGETHDIDDYFRKVAECPEDRAIIASASPQVSKKGKSYYRVVLSNKIAGMVFRFIKKLQVGMKVKYKLEDPFLDLLVCND